MIEYNKSFGSFWIRIFGVGISAVHRALHPPLFSERMGFRKSVMIGKYRVKWLKRSVL